MGKTPSFSQTQSVLSHIWGRGMKLEIHLRPESRSMLVRIPNSTIRNKIVQQEFWHIGNVLFYVAQWSADVALHPPTFTSMPLWAHFRGIPFDLYTQEGLGRVGDLLGHPIEVDEFTRRMTNISVAHIKCRIDCTKPLPRFGELERENGEVVSVSIDYPWVPPFCSCCNELGHLVTHCPSGKWKPKPPPKPSGPTTTPQSSPVPEVQVSADAQVTSEMQVTFDMQVTAPAQDSASMDPVLAADRDDPGPILPSVDPLTSGLVVVPTVCDLEESTPAVPGLSLQAASPIDLDADGSIITPPSSPSSPFSPPPSSPLVPPSQSKSPPPSPISAASPFFTFSQSGPSNHPPPPSSISHLLALPAIHHPRPVKTSITPHLCIASTDSKFHLSQNPFACLAPDPPSPSSSTTPAVGSLLPAGEKTTPQ